MKRRIGKSCTLSLLLAVVIFFNACLDGMKDSVLFDIPNMIECLMKPREDVTKMLGDEAENFQSPPERGEYILISDRYEIENLPLMYICLFYRAATYVITDLFLDTNVISFQAIEEDDFGKVEALMEVRYVFRYDTEEEFEQIWKWANEQKETLAEYFGHSCDFEYGLTVHKSMTMEDFQKQEWNNGQSQWIFDVEGSDEQEHRLAYCYDMEVFDTTIAVVLRTNQSHVMRE